MSYLDVPRIHFSGYFQADVSTINNDARHYDNSRFQKEYQDYRVDGTDNNWNPNGTGIFRFFGCTVTGAVLNLNNTPSYSDPIIGITLENADRQPPAKIIDLDPQQQASSEIWALQVRLCNSKERAFFIGDMKPDGFMNLWQWQQTDSALNDQKLAATYQSCS